MQSIFEPLNVENWHEIHMVIYYFQSSSVGDGLRYEYIIVMTDMGHFWLKWDQGSN